MKARCSMFCGVFGLLVTMLLCLSPGSVNAAGFWGGNGTYDGTAPNNKNVTWLKGASAGASASITNLYFVVAPAGNGTPVCNSIRTAGSTNWATLYWMTPTNYGTVVTNTLTTGAAVTNVTVAGSNLCASGTFLLIRHVAKGEYTLCQATNSSTNVTGSVKSWVAIDRVPRFQILAGDVVYAMETQAIDPVGQATNSLVYSTGGLFFGKAGNPALLMLVDTTNRAENFQGILSAGGDYR